MVLFRISQVILLCPPIVFHAVSKVVESSKVWCKYGRHPRDEHLKVNIQLIFNYRLNPNFRKESLHFFLLIIDYWLFGCTTPKFWHAFIIICWPIVLNESFYMFLHMISSNIPRKNLLFLVLVWTQYHRNSVTGDVSYSLRPAPYHLSRFTPGIIRVVPWNLFNSGQEAA